MLTGNCPIREAWTYPEAGRRNVLTRPDPGLKTIFITALISLVLVQEVYAQVPTKKTPLNLAVEYIKMDSRESALKEQRIISVSCPRIAAYLLKEINQ